MAKDLPGGFVLGTSWDQAQAHAAAQGWAVTKDEFAPDQWHVSGAEVTLSVCDGRIVQLSRHFKGDMTDVLDEVDHFGQRRDLGLEDVDHPARHGVVEAP